MVVIVISSLIFSGCFANQEVLQQDTSSEESSEETKGRSSTDSDDISTASTHLEINHQVFTETFYDDNEHEMLLEVSIMLPYLSNPDDDPGKRVINELYTQKIKEMKNNVINQLLVYAKADKQSSVANAHSFMPYAYDSTFTINYQSKDYLSILHSAYSFSGGAHPNMFLSAETFDLRTGKQLALADFISGSQEQPLEKVYQWVTSEIEKTKGTNEFYVYEDTYKQDIRIHFAVEDFVLQSDHLMVFYQQDSISPYATGFQLFKIPYREDDVFVKAIPQIKEDALKQEITFAAIQLLKQNKVIVHEIYELSMLKLAVPQDGFGDQTIFPVVDNRFQTFRELEAFIKSTYVASYASALLQNGRYIEKNGKLYGDIMKDGGRGYYLDSNNFRFEIQDLASETAQLLVHTVENAPSEDGIAKPKEVTLKVQLIKENNIWLLKQMMLDAFNS